jgi:hypothetical protein
MTLSLTTLSIMTFSVTTLSIIAFSIRINNIIKIMKLATLTKRHIGLNVNVHTVL